MDRAERLISNRGSRRILLCWIAGLLLAAAGAWLLSGKIAAGFLAREIRAVLHTAGGGSPTEPPDPARIAAGYAQYAGIGVSEAAPSQLFPDYGAVRTAAFLALFGFSALLLTGFALCAYRQTDRIYRSLEQIYQDCLRLADHPGDRFTGYGSESGSLRKVCSGIGRLSDRFRHAESALQKDKQQLTDFLADYSHQIKGALSVIRLNRDMLDELDLPQDERERLSGEITEQLDRTEALVLEGLKLAKLDAAAVQYRFTEQSLAETCRIAEQRVRPLFRQKGIALTLDADSGILFPHDRVWLCEALENLLRNSAEHAGCTETVIALEQLPGAVKLTVTDNGAGIPPDRLRHLFDRFSSGSSAPNHTGIGMAIANRIFSAHGGALTVFSAPGSGTQFLAVFCGQPAPSAEPQSGSISG